MKQRPKLIFLDIDGTILPPEGTIRPAVRMGLQKARENGHKIFICTGRPCNELPEELAEIELDGIISSAGSDIWIEGRNIYRVSLDQELIRKACRILDGLNSIYMLEGYEETFLSPKGREVLLEEEISETDNSEMARWKQFVRSINDVRSVGEWNPKRSPIPKVTFMLWKKEDIKTVRETMERDFYIAFSHDMFASLYNGELISKTDDKGTAILRLTEYLHADIADTIAFGDSMNDYQMIRQAACGVAMGDGAKELKAIADRVCETAEEDGVIREMERMGLI